MSVFSVPESIKAAIANGDLIVVLDHYYQKVQRPATFNDIVVFRGNDFAGCHIYITPDKPYRARSHRNMLCFVDDRLDTLLVYADECKRTYANVDVYEEIPEAALIEVLNV